MLELLSVIKNWYFQVIVCQILVFCLQIWKFCYNYMRFSLWRVYCHYWGVHKRSELLTFHLYSSNSSETHQTDCSFHHTFTMLLLSRGVKPTFLCLAECNHNYLCALERWLVNTCHQCLRACVRFKDLDHQTWGEVLIIHLSPSVGADFSPLL